MGLIGTWKKYTYSDHSTETETVSVTYPDDPSFGDLAGTTVQQQRPVQVETVETFENAYVMISQFYAIRDQGETDEVYFLDYRYNVYASKAARDADFQDTIDSEFMTKAEDVVFDGSQDIAAHCYSKLKALRGFELLTDD